VQREATAQAHANIALVKYWGKRDGALNLPAAGSLSLTLAALTTRTTVCFDDSLAADELVLDGRRAEGPEVARLSAWLDLVREPAGLRQRARVVSDNDFPTASGLASSASAYAALALAATRAAGMELTDRGLSVLARRGSGSAARSIFGGFAVWWAGTRADGTDSYAEPLVALEALADWPLRMVIAVVGGGRAKSISSRAAMSRCADTSPLYRGWLDAVPGDLTAARGAIERRDFHALGEVAERSALAMHAAAMASRPSIIYFQPATIACIHAVQAMRGDDLAAYFTIDAGPHVKVLTLAEHVDDVAGRLRAVDGVTDVIVSEPGGPARLCPGGTSEGTARP
jgi:diphosphomevalonate decarboxylase